MHYAIIAAGEGSRLRQEGITVDKPLAPIQGRPMIDRLISLMLRCHAESISVICNSSMPAVAQHLRSLNLSVPLHIIEAQTPSSMHSLARLSEVIPMGKVCVTTVDTIFRPLDFMAYISAFERADHPLFVVTPFVEDEKPLWVTLDARQEQRITAFCDDVPTVGERYVSGGIYGLITTTAWPVLRQCLAQGQSRMRNYQRALLAAGHPVHGHIFGCVFDVDHAADLQRANEWLSSPDVVAVRRAPGHSPNNVEQDAAILQAVADRLERQGLSVSVINEADMTSGDVRSQLASCSVVVHMARTLLALTRLASLSAPVVNAPRQVALVAGSREYVLTALQTAGVSVPPWWAYDPEEDEMFQCDAALHRLLPGWVKATRREGALPDDVSWVETPLEADVRVMELAASQPLDLVVTHHIEGDLLKVYCVGQTFIRAFYPQESGYSKYGTHEQHNTPLARYAYDPEALAHVAHTIGSELGLQVFGFDAIITPDGDIVVIDVNDWPSFSLCRQEAADAIVRLIIDSTSAQSSTLNSQPLSE